MSRVKVELNYAAVGELMKSPQMMNVCERLADRAVDYLGQGYEVTTRVGKTRVNAEVAAVSYEARRDNLSHNSILKALGAVRE